MSLAAGAKGGQEMGSQEEKENQAEKEARRRNSNAGKE